MPKICNLIDDNVVESLERSESPGNQGMGSKDILRAIALRSSVVLGKP